MLAACLEAGAAGWLGKDAVPRRGRRRPRHCAHRHALIGIATRDAMVDELASSTPVSAGRSRHRTPDPTRTPRAGCATAKDMSAEEIAEQHYVALTTVRSQIRAVLQKLGVRSQLSSSRPRQPRRLEARRQRPRTHLTPGRRSASPWRHGAPHRPPPASLSASTLSSTTHEHARAPVQLAPAPRANGGPHSPASF